MRLRHILGVSIPKTEARILRDLRAPRYHLYIFIFGIVGLVTSPYEPLYDLPLANQLVFWLIGSLLFALVYGMFQIGILRLTLRMGRTEAPEIAVMAATVLVLAPIMVGVMTLIGVTEHDWPMLAYSTLVTFIMLELASYLYLRCADVVLFPEMYAAAMSDPRRTGRPGALVLHGTTLPVAKLEVIIAQKRETEVRGMGEVHFLGKGFNEVIANLPVDLGFQIHRSIWVSGSIAEQLERAGRRLCVVGPDGRRLPVARSREREFENWLALRRQARSRAG